MWGRARVGRCQIECVEALSTRIAHQNARSGKNKKNSEVIMIAEGPLNHFFLFCFCVRSAGVHIRVLGFVPKCIYMYHFGSF